MTYVTTKEYLFQIGDLAIPHESTTKMSCNYCANLIELLPDWKDSYKKYTSGLRTLTLEFDIAWMIPESDQLVMYHAPNQPIQCVVYAVKAGTATFFQGKVLHNPTISAKANEVLLATFEVVSIGGELVEAKLDESRMLPTVKSLLK